MHKVDVCNDDLDSRYLEASSTATANAVLR